MANKIKNTITPGGSSIPVIHRLKLRTSGHQASWKKFGEGSAQLTLDRHIEAGWVEIELTESAENSSRTALITLNAAQATALVEFITRTQ